MKYKVINKEYDYINEEGLLETLLKTRGVENIEKFLDVNKSNVLDGKLLKNLEMGLIELYTYINQPNKAIKIHIVVDCDTDGYTSAALTYRYLKDILKDSDNNVSITYSFHEGKQHGIILNELESYDYDFLIVPDAGSNDIEQCKKLKEENKKILILDHHNIEKENKNAIVVNCQDGSYSNNTLSGVGVAYKFFKEFDKTYGSDYINQYLDYVAIGMVADDMDLRNLETRYLVLSGLKLINEKKRENNLIQEIMNKNKIEKLSILDIGWVIAPLINAVVRVGTMEEKINAFKALIGEKELIEYQPRRKKKTDPKPSKEVHSLQKTMARQLTNIKSRQDRKVSKGVDILKEKISLKKLNDNKVIYVDGTKELESTFTGLVANKLASFYKRPTIILRKKYENVYGGSGRNYELFELNNLQKFLINLNCFNHVSGHDNAFGFELNANKIEEAIALSNEKLKDTKIEDCYFVDYEIPIGRLKNRHIKQVGEWREIWGNTLKEPLFAITDIYISTDDIRLQGEKKNVVRFVKKIGGKETTFIKFFANESILNKFICKNTIGIGKKVNKVKIDLIGKFKINEYNNMKFPQIEIIDFNSTEAKDFLF